MQLLTPEREGSMVGRMSPYVALWDDVERVDDCCMRSPSLTRPQPGHINSFFRQPRHQKLVEVAVHSLTVWFNGRVVRGCGLCVKDSVRKQTPEISPRPEAQQLSTRDLHAAPKPHVLSGADSLQFLKCWSDCGKMLQLISKVGCCLSSRNLRSLRLLQQDCTTSTNDHAGALQAPPTP